MDKKLKFLIDTDIGDEIDDALALYAAMRMGLDIVGVTTVFRNTKERARIAKDLLIAYGKGYENVPVLAGYGSPTGESERDGWEHTCHYCDALDREDLSPDGKSPSDAVDFIIDCCKKWGEELVVVCLGPLTNLAHAIQKDADALSRVKKTVIMGGAFFKQYADWNVTCDAKAADVVFKRAHRLECIGADVTHTLDIGKENYEYLLNFERGDGAAAKMREYLTLWKNDVPDRSPTLHDPLAIYYAADESVCDMTDVSVKVITEGAAMGMTLNVDAYSKAYMNPAYDGGIPRKVAVAKSVDSRKIIESFMALFK
jgi:inosine-uridine nucleoside N-ribohydrolase